MTLLVVRENSLIKVVVALIFAFLVHHIVALDANV